MNKGPPVQWKDGPEFETPITYQTGPVVKNVRAGLNDNPTNVRSSTGPTTHPHDAGNSKWNSIIHLLFVLGVGLFLLTLNG